MSCRLLSAALALTISASLAISAPFAHAAREKAEGSRASGVSAKAYTGTEVTDGGAIAGYVVAHDPPRPRRDYPVTTDRRVCGDHVPDESLLISKEGRVANVVVSIEGIRKGKPVDQRIRPRLAAAGCRFVPHVLAVSVGQKIVIYNGDPLLHTVRAVMDPHTTVFDVSLPVQNQKIPKLIRSPGIMKLDSGAGHVWMSGWILAFNHPYFAVTGDDGTFSIKGVPPGTYEIRAWHEVLGTQIAKVTISPGATSEVVFDDLSNAPSGG